MSEWKQLREARGLSRGEVAAQMSRAGGATLTVAQIARIENGGRSSQEELAALAVVYGTEPDAAPEEDSDSPLVTNEDGTEVRVSWRGLYTGSPVRLLGDDNGTWEFRSFQRRSERHQYVEVVGQRSKNGRSANVRLVSPCLVLRINGMSVLPPEEGGGRPAPQLVLTILKTDGTSKRARFELGGLPYLEPEVQAKELELLVRMATVKCMQDNRVPAPTVDTWKWEVTHDGK